MRIALIIALVVSIAAISGIAGYRAGLGRGGKTMGAIAAQNEVSNALRHIDASLRALDRHDLEYSMRQHQRDLDEALVELGTYAPAVPYWNCKENDRNIVADAGAYLKGHPAGSPGPLGPFVDQALKFCQQ